MPYEGNAVGISVGNAIATNGLTPRGPEAAQAEDLKQTTTNNARKRATNHGGGDNGGGGSGFDDKGGDPVSQLGLSTLSLHRRGITQYRAPTKPLTSLLKLVYP